MPGKACSSHSGCDGRPIWGDGRYGVEFEDGVSEPFKDVNVLNPGPEAPEDLADSSLFRFVLNGFVEDDGGVAADP
jgi:hypothetical protein